VTVSIQKFRIIVLVSNRTEYLSNYSIRNFEYSHSTSLHSYVNQRLNTSVWTLDHTVVTDACTELLQQSGVFDG